jgi:hypothetical protein
MDERENPALMKAEIVVLRAQLTAIVETLGL